jgi:hypothetical protein
VLAAVASLVVILRDSAINTRLQHSQACVGLPSEGTRIELTLYRLMKALTTDVGLWTLHLRWGVLAHVFVLNCQLSEEIFRP